jgi:cytochrome c-type biogenesis protein CcmH/NrfF
MKLNVSHSWWRVCWLSAIAGALLGSAIEFLRRAYNNYQDQLTSDRFERLGMSPPLMVDNLHWWAIPLWTAMIFMIVGFLMYGLWFKRAWRKKAG